MLTDLRQRGVTFQPDGDRIRVNAPAGAIDGRGRELLAENKPALLKLLEWERRRLREAERRGLAIKWAKERGWISLHDPTTGEWHEVKASDCPRWIVDAANARPCRGGPR